MIKQSFTLSVTMLILSFLCPAFLNAQIVTDKRMFSFEEPQLPACITGVQSQLGISGAHYKDGKHSLEWTFEPNGRLELRKDLKFEKKDPTGKDLYLSAFIVWIYNEQPQDAAIEFEFLKDGRKCVSFPFGINFKGWRAAWVCYERDMQGTPEEGMNELRIVAPDAKGRLFIDHLITATKVDARQQTADLQVPFVNAGTTNHWLVLYKHSLLKPDIELTPVSDKQRQEMKLLEKRFRDMIYTKGKVTEKEAETIRKKYDLYQITYKDGQAVKLRLLEPMAVADKIIPRNAVVVGTAKIQGERLDIEITSLEYAGTIIPVELAVYDTDGQPGIFIPNSMEMNAVREVAANMGGSLGSSINISTNAGAQLASDLGKGLIQGTSQYIAKKMRTVKVHLKAGYKVMLYQDRN